MVLRVFVKLPPCSKNILKIENLLLVQKSMMMMMTTINLVFLFEWDKGHHPSKACSIVH